MIAFSRRFCHNDETSPVSRLSPSENMPMPLHPRSCFSLVGPFRPPAVLILSLLLWFTPEGGAADEAATTAAAAVEELRLETSDGIRIAAWYYPAPEEARATATVILIHDLEGSHKTVDHLARSLQRSGCAVVAPDLRGHGGSARSASGGSGAGAKVDPIEPRMLKKIDLESIAAATGGRLREQCTVSGEIEAVRNWIRRKSDAGTLDIDRLCVVGCGLGGTLASLWTVADWNWPPTTSGPQGRQVRALALVSPIWATKGISMSLPLTSEAIKTEVPIMVLAGKSDRDAIRLFDQLKRLRPDAWFQQRIDQPPEKAKALEDAAKGTAFFIQADTSLTGDKLADDPSMNVAEQINTFFSLALSRTRD
jgi:pimeloyl-ACP methyl ester carboxylesterase